MKRRTTFVAMAALGLLLAACQPRATEPPPTPTPADYLRMAAGAMANVKSAQFTLTREGTPVVLDPTLGAAFVSATGKYQAPDQVHANIKADLLGSVLALDMLWLPDGIYMSNPFTGAYGPIQFEPPLDPIALFGAETGISYLLVESVTDPAEVGTETLEGAQARHLTGKIDAAALAALIPGAPAGSLDLDLWLDLETHRVIRLRVTEETGDQTVLDIFAYDEPVTIPSPSG